jgi:polyisoprenoid-binding protein YceI
MKNVNMKKISITAMLFTATCFVLQAQVQFQAVSTKIQVAGTSTLHEWSMASESARCNLVLDLNGTNISGLSSLSFTLQAETLKSDHKALDKNAYKALNTGKHPLISFNSNYANIRPAGQNSFVISAKGQLTISGVTKDVWIAGTTTINPADMTLETRGSLKVKMSEYDVQPPTLMLGVVKAGDDVTVKFDVTLKK